MCCRSQTAPSGEPSRSSMGLSTLGDAGSSTPPASVAGRRDPLRAPAPLSHPSDMQQPRPRPATCARGKPRDGRQGCACRGRPGCGGYSALSPGLPAGGPQDRSSGSSVGAWSPAGQEQGRVDGATRDRREQRQAGETRTAGHARAGGAAKVG